MGIIGKLISRNDKLNLLYVIKLTKLKCKRIDIIQESTYQHKIVHIAYIKLETTFYFHYIKKIYN